MAKAKIPYFDKGQLLYKDIDLKIPNVEKHYEVAIHQRKEIRSGEYDYSTFDYLHADNYADAVRIAKYWSSPEHKYNYCGICETDEKIDEVGFTEVICYTEPKGEYKTIYYEYYENGKKTYRGVGDYFDSLLNKTIFETDAD